MAHDTLYAIGEALIDMIPSKTGCSFAEVPSFSPRVGGAPANVCGAYARLGGASALLTQLGDDPFGHKIIDELAACGIDTSHICLTDKANTALALTLTPTCAFRCGRTVMLCAARCWSSCRWPMWSKSRTKSWNF